MTTKLSGKVLLVDDEEEVLEIISEQLSSFGFVVSRANSGEKAIELLKVDKYDLVVTDLAMPEMSGGDFVSKLNEDYPELAIIVITGQTMIDDLSLFSGNVLHFLSKPFSEQDLYEAVSEI